MQKSIQNKEYSNLPMDDNDFYRQLLLQFENLVFKEKHYSNTNFVYKILESIDKVTIIYLSTERVYRNCENDFLSAENIVLVLNKDVEDILNIATSKLCTKRGDLILTKDLVFCPEIAKESSISHIFTNEKVTTCSFEYSYMVPYNDMQDEAMHEFMNDKADYSIIIKPEEIIFNFSVQNKGNPQVKKDSRVLTYEELSKLIGLMYILEYSSNQDRNISNDLVIHEKYILDMDAHTELIKEFLTLHVDYINRWISLIEMSKIK